MITLRIKPSKAGDLLCQVWPDDHPEFLQEPPWRPTDQFSPAIRGAISAARLELGSREGKVCFTQAQWTGFFLAAEQLASRRPGEYEGWGEF
jgi:hypothetical protein